MGQIFKALYTLAFFSFLRLSNFVPHTRATFSLSQQLATGDIISAPPGLLLIIIWSKTIQARNAAKILKIPSLGSNPICPVNAVKPFYSSPPEFAIILKKLNLQNSNITFDAFQCSGATYAFNCNIQLQDIQSHGTWMLLEFGDLLFKILTNFNYHFLASAT